MTSNTQVVVQQNFSDFCDWSQVLQELQDLECLITEKDSCLLDLKKEVHFALLSHQLKPVDHAQ